MTVDQARLLQHRDQVLRDIIELDAQVATGEIPAGQAQDLRRRYQAAAAQAITALAALPEAEPPEAELAEGEPAGSDAHPTPAAARPSARRPARRVVYALAAAAAVFAVAVLLPRYVADRPPGGFVTGNEVGGTLDAMPGGRDLSTVNTNEMETVVAANPDVVGMRVALANRYTDQGAYDRAVRHYTQALQVEPGNAEAHAHLGWLLLQINQPKAALEHVQLALAADPTLLDALWFTANIELSGLGNPAAALAALDAMRQHPQLTNTVRLQVDKLAGTARARLAQAGR